jgi:hypothetical protein
MVAVAAWRSVTMIVPSAGTMGPWSAPLVFYGGCDGNDGMEELVVAGFQ